jgi:hypothetical protein
MQAFSGSVLSDEGAITLYRADPYVLQCLDTYCKEPNQLAI